MDEVFMVPYKYVCFWPDPPGMDHAISIDFT